MMLMMNFRMDNIQELTVIKATLLVIVHSVCGHGLGMSGLIFGFLTFAFVYIRMFYLITGNRSNIYRCYICYVVLVATIFQLRTFLDDGIRCHQRQ